MQPQITATGPALSEDDLAQFEQRTSISLPEPYRAFLMRHNGGKPQPYYYDVPQWSEGESAVNEFNAVRPGRYNDLEANMELLEARLPAGFVPIADDPGGNTLLIGTLGATRGKIYFWDHEQEPEASSEQLEDYPNIHPVAEDFGEFLARLRAAR